MVLPAGTSWGGGTFGEGFLNVMLGTGSTLYNSEAEKWVIQSPGLTQTFELYDELQKDPRTSRVPVLFETASGAEAMIEFRRRGIATYVRKPFDLNVIVGYVKRLATGASADSPSVSALPPRA